MSELDWIDIFAGNLRDMLIDANMSQRELADASGLAESTISSYINKQKIPSLKAIINISYALDCDVTELIDFGDTIE
jgi:transcriptional regulator with XRE-family HTH domain